MQTIKLNVYSDIRKFSAIILLIQLALWISISLDIFGVHIPLLRQLIGFIYLTFIPGIIIIRILKFDVTNLEMFLYTAGLSIASIMFIGFFMNLFYPSIGINNPLSLEYFMVTMSILVLVGIILIIISCKGASDRSFVCYDVILSPPAVSLYLIAFLSVISMYVFNFFANNRLVILLLLFIILLPIVIFFSKFIPYELYPLAIFVASFSLLFHRSLISMYLWGWDIQIEYYFSNMVLMKSVWDPAISNGTNAMLSLIILPNVYASICNINLIWVFKIIYPFIFSLLPIGLYKIIQKQTDNKIAFLSCYFLIISPFFFDWMSWLAKQEIAELFLILIILLFLDDNIDGIRKSILLIIFCMSLAVSHYGLTYLFVFSLFFVLLILKGLSFLAKYSSLTYIRKLNFKVEKNVISLNFFLLVVVFTISWYIYISNSQLFIAITNIGDRILSNLYEDFLNPNAGQGLNLLFVKTDSPLQQIHKLIYYINLFLIMIGVLSLLRVHRMKFNRVFALFSIANFIILISGAIIPFFAMAITMQRLYQIAIIYLSPFCVIGGRIALNFMGNIINKLTNIPWTLPNEEKVLKGIAIYFSIVLLFNSNIIYFLEYNQKSPSLNTTNDRACFNDQEAAMAQWLKAERNENMKIISDRTRGALLYSVFGARYVFYGSEDQGLTKIRGETFESDRIEVTENINNSYFFLGKENILNNNLVIQGPSSEFILDIKKPKNRTTLLNYILFDTSLIYNSGYGHIYSQGTSLSPSIIPDK